VKSTIEIRTKAVVFFEEGIRSAKEIGETYNISEMTVKRWAENHHDCPENGLRPKKTGAKRSPRATPDLLPQKAGSTIPGMPGNYSDNATKSGSLIVTPGIKNTTLKQFID
jgi:hypothetical protein